MTAAKVCVAGKADFVGQFSLALAGKLAEQAPGGGVVLGNGGFEEPHRATDAAVNDMVEHSQSQALPARSIANCHLPDKNRVGTFGYKVAGDGADKRIVDLGNDRAMAEMGALQQIAVEGIRVKRGAFSDELVNSRAVCRDGFPQARKPVGAVRFLRCNDYTP